MAPSRFVVSVQRVSGGIVRGGGRAIVGLALASPVGCIDGATPNCAGDAGCGPGIEASQLIDAGGDVSSAQVIDGASDATVEAASDTGSTPSPDSGSDVATPSDAPLGG